MHGRQAVERPLAVIQLIAVGIKNDPASLNDPLTVVAITVCGQRQRIQGKQRSGNIAKACGVQRGLFFGEDDARIILQIGRFDRQVALAHDAAHIATVAVVDMFNGQGEIAPALYQPAAVVVQALPGDCKIAPGGNQPSLVSYPGRVYSRILTGYQRTLRIIQRPGMNTQRPSRAEGAVAVVQVISQRQRQVVPGAERTALVVNGMRMQLQGRIRGQRAVAVIYVFGPNFSLFHPGKHAVLVVNTASVHVQFAKADDAARRLVISV